MSDAPQPLWRQREYMLLWSGQVVTTLGAQASGIIYPLLILALTGSPAQASWATALRMLPYLALSLPVGALIDRWDRRRVMLVCHIGRGLAVASVPLAMALDSLVVAHIYAVAVLEGALHVFFNIAETAALPRVVALRQLPQATAQNQAGFATASIVGPALGSWLYQAVGRGFPFVVDAASHVLGAAAVWRLRSSFAPALDRPTRPLRAEVAEGMRWLWNQRVVRDMALITCVLNGVNAALPLLLIVLGQERGASEAQIGLIFSLGGVGAIVGALLGGALAQRLRFGQAIGLSVGVRAVCIPLLLLCPGPLSLGAVYALASLFGPLYDVVQFSYRIALIPDALQGRVNSSFRLFAFLLTPVGAAACGWLLERGGTAWAVGVFGAVCALLAVAVRLDPAVRNAPRQPLGAPVD
ncbi:MAG: MFS transporter [Rubrivivax sp.]|nr:MFS transporter [Rubrivivax sp.]